jgi:hypothetical protein
MLFADSFTDLVVFDISNRRKIVEKTRLNNVFPYYYISPKIDNDFPVHYNYQNNTTDNIVVDWDIKLQKRKPQNDDILYGNGGIKFNTKSSEGSVIGKGGSLASFMIVEDYLYAVDNY